MKGNRMWTRILAVLLAMAMVFGSNAMTSLAENTVVVGLVNDKEKETETGSPAESEAASEEQSEDESESDLMTPAEGGTEGSLTEAGTEESETETEASATEADTEMESGTEPESESETQMPVETETESESRTEAEIVTTTQEVDGTVIEVSYPADAFEEEVILQATAITEGEQYEEVKSALDELQENDESFSYGTFVAFDITFLSVATGGEVEPLKDVSVSIRLSGEQQPEETENTNLVHIPEESGKAEVVENAQISADAAEVTFQNDEFSTYILTSGNQKIAVGAVTVTAEDGILVGKYATLKDALAAAADGTTVTVNQNLTGVEQIGEMPVTVNASVTIDLGGNTIDAQGGNGIFKHTQKANRTITIKNGRLTGAKNPNSGSTDRAVSAMGVMANWTVNLTSLTIDGNSSEGSGGAIYCEKKINLNLDHCIISGNTSGTDGGGIYIGNVANVTAQLMNPVISVQGGTISDNQASGSGGGIAVFAGAYATLKLTDLTISGNEAENAGGGLFAGRGNTGITLTNCTVSGNKAKETNQERTGTEATLGGGGIYSESVLTVSGGAVTGNEAKEGGGICAKGPTTLTGGLSLSDNKAVGQRSVDFDSDLHVLHTYAQGGGGLYFQYMINSTLGSSSLKIEDGVTISGNTAANGVGAGVLISYGTNWTVSKAVAALGGNVTISGNGKSDSGQTGIVLSKEDFEAALGGTGVKLLASLGGSLPEELSQKTEVIGNTGGVFSFRMVEEGGIQYLETYVPEFIYLNGETGDDTENGSSPETAVRTYEKAEELLLDKDGAIICVTGTVTPENGGTTWPTEKWTKNSVPLLRRDTEFTGRLVYIPAGTVLTLGNKGRGIELDGNRSTASGVNAPLIDVDAGGTLLIQEGAVLRNNRNESSGFESGGAVHNSGTVEMTGGLIENNVAANGGGIELWGGSMKMSGGIISKNEIGGSNEGDGAGGGIAAVNGAQLTVSGDAEISYNKALAFKGKGGGIAIYRIFTNSDNRTSKLTMTGGTVRGNQAQGSGGGIYVEATCEADITGGDITGNHNLNTSGYGGGGIYVNGGKEGYGNGILRLKNVLITGNESIRNSSFVESIQRPGGLGACFTADVQIYVTNGGAIFGNKGNMEVYLQKNSLDPGSQGERGDVFISEYMLGGGAYRWTDEDGNYIPLNMLQSVTGGMYRLGNNPSDAAQKAAIKNADVRITGNTAKAGGGGIGTNGTVIIGTENGESMDIPVQKRWADSAYDNILENVNVWLLNVSGEPDFVGYLQLKWNGTWQDTVTFKDMPKSNTYDVLEEYILKDGTHVWSAEGKQYKPEIDALMGSTAYRWSEDAYYDTSVTGSQTEGFVIDNTPAVEVNFEARKTYIVGGTEQELSGGEFSFTAVEVDADGNVLLKDDGSGNRVPVYNETVTNRGGGDIVFPKVRFVYDKAGNNTYYFRIEENNRGAEGVVYDTSVYTVRVDLKFDEEGRLEAVQSIQKDDAETDAITFANTFAGSVTLTKRSTGSTPENPQLLAGAQFELYYRANENADWAQYGNEPYVTGADGTLTVNELPAGDYYFVETQAPAGYVIATNTDGTPMRYPFTIGIEGEQAVVHAVLDVTNAPEPETETETESEQENVELTVTKQLMYQNELWNAVDQTFYVALYSDAALTSRVTELQPIVFRNSNTSSTTFRGLEYDRTYYVGETNDEGVVLNTMGGVIASGQTFSVDFNAGNAVTFTRGNGTQVITFRNMFTELPPEFYREGNLTVTKQLLGADGVKRSSGETFYAGIFSDAGYTQLSGDVDQNIVKLALGGASSVSADVKVTVPQGGSTTVYVTEVDKDGKPVAGAASFRYDVTVDGTTVTMDETNLSGTVVITNQEREETETEIESEIFEEGGDTVVPASANSVKTGDDTPIGLYLGLMAAAALVLFVALMLKRRKRS